MIPLARPSFDERELEAVREVLESGWLVQGPKVVEFEARLAQLQGTKHCVVVSSGTAALHLVYLALGIGPGDAVFIPSFAWPSAANMAVRVGARPVFADVLPDTYNMDPESLRREIRRCRQKKWGTPKAVVPVHQFGLVADMDAIMAIAQNEGIPLVIEDAACALGAKDERGRPAGSIGKAGIFSFHPRKVITTGEGGAITTNDGELAAELRRLRNHGQEFIDGRRKFPTTGFNYRLTDIQAAIGLTQLGKLKDILDPRRRTARMYVEKLTGSDGLRLPAAPDTHTWQTFMIVLEAQSSRHSIVSEMGPRGVQASQGSVAAHCNHVYRRLYGCDRGSLPVATQLEEKGLALPLYAGMCASEVDKVISVFRKAISSLVSRHAVGLRNAAHECHGEKS